MTRILQLITSADPKGGGPIEAAQRIGEVWMKHGHVHDLLTLDPPDEFHLPNYRGHIFRLGTERGRSIQARYRYSPAMVPWLEANAKNYDAIIVSGLWRYLARGARKALAKGPVPYFVFTHGMLDPWFKKAYPLKHVGKQISWWWAEGPLLAHAKRTLFTCEEEKILADNAFWPYDVKAQVVSYGAKDVDGNPEQQIAAFRKAVPQLGNRPYFLFLSRIHRKKGCDLLINAFASISAVNSNLDLVVAGPDEGGLIPKLKTQAELLGISDRVHFPGMLTGDVKIGAFRAAEAFTLTSHQENFGIVVAESLACGTPVLISNKVNIWREIVEDKAGLVESDTRDGSINLFSRFIAMNKEEHSAMRLHARNSFVKRFNIDNAAKLLLDVIHSEIHK